jgi:hypothetical protein
MSKEGPDHQKRKSHARPDRIIEKRPNWQDYLDPDEDPGLLEDDDLSFDDRDLLDDLIREEERDSER